MKTQASLELCDVKAIAAAAEAEALKNNWAVSIAIVDAGGHLLHFARLDGAAPVSSHIAPAKAHTAALAAARPKVMKTSSTVAALPSCRPPPSRACSKVVCPS